MVQTVCMPGKFAALCKKLTDEQKLIIRRIGLGSLLSIPSMPIQRMLVESLVESYNETDRTFNLYGHVLPISMWDVYCIFGLIDKGEKIEFSRKPADPVLFNLYKQAGDTAITFKYLEERIPTEANEDHFTRLFVLYAIGTILAPTSKEYIGSNYLHVVANVPKIKSFNWARFTLEHLLEHLALFKKSKRSGICGNLALLQVWFFEHFRASGDCFDYASHEHPLIKHWNESKVLKRARLEGIKKFGAEKVITQLDPNESKARTGNGNFDQDFGDQYTYDGVRHDFFEKEVQDEKFEKEEANLNGLHDGNKDEKIAIKETLESMKILLERTNKFAEVHTIVQMLVKLADENNSPEKCNGKQSESSGTSKPGGSHSTVHEECGKTSTAEKVEKTEKVQPCPESGVKRKINFASSPSLVDKVKKRTNRQPSKVFKSPYRDINQKRASTTKFNGSYNDEITGGLNLSMFDLAAITYIREQIVIAPRKDLVSIGAITLTARQFDCLLRPMREDGGAKWLCSGIISSYATMFNSDWSKATEKKKHAILAEQSDWLQNVIGKDWIRRGQPYYKCCKDFMKPLLEADMVFIPMNTTNTHWWLCVLYPGKSIIQVLDSFNTSKTYVQETRKLLYGIHSILQAAMLSSQDFNSRWTRYDVLNWDVVVKKNIPYDVLIARSPSVIMDLGSLLYIATKRVCSNH